MHPDGSNGSFSVVRFTAPKDGNYVLDVIFTSIESCARHSGVYIIYNNVTTLWEIDLNGPEDSKSFKTTDSGIPIRANENIDFIVGEGLNRVICHMTLAQLDIHLLENQTKFPIIAGSIGFGFVLGEDPFKKFFQFLLDTSEFPTIGLLKDAIITSQKLDFAAKEVKLWSVDFPITDANVNKKEKLDIINKCTNINVNIEDELGGVELPTFSMCSNEFITQKNLQHAHIIVQLPTGKKNSYSLTPCHITDYSCAFFPAFLLTNPPKKRTRVIVERPVDDLKSTLEKLESKIDLIRSEVGNVYETSARLEIAKTNGSHYSSKFEISDLNGFIRLSLPRKKFANEKSKYDTPIYIQGYRANRLSYYIYNKNMKTALEESIKYIRSLPRINNFIESLNTLADRAEQALNDWKAFEKNSPNSSENRLFLANTKFLGVMLITSYIIDPKIAIENNHAPFNEVLELDIRGKPTSYHDTKNVSIEIGEIKLTTKNLLHGYRQLLIRLAALGYVIEALNSNDKDDEIADYSCDLVGILYVPKVPHIDVPSEWENGIKFPKGTTHTIRIVAVGDKP
ncbi:hypothetical protein RclHR1_03280023 [Rhizophagus clarus]|uniref:Uncharacterized protein n=1 Tax=Rhizophagus clarus TaxID=94130 RepID=A0A2Z6R8H2_9GLOM|nr:hypothetical protein RclHR1_03280023 [Rhizophagus clarus]